MEMNFDKSTIGLNFLLVSSMLAKYLKLYTEYFEVKYTNSKGILRKNKEK